MQLCISKPTKGSSVENIFTRGDGSRRAQIKSTFLCVCHFFFLFKSFLLLPRLDVVVISLSLTALINQSHSTEELQHLISN